MLWLIPFPAYLVSKLLFFTLRKELIDCDEFLRRWKSREPMIVVLWHNRALFAATFYLWIGGGPAAGLVSQSFEGVLASRIFRFFRDAKVVWGSSTRGGEEGMKEMIEFGKKGHHLALTPDGPLGPVYQMKPGAVRIAQATGYPIYPWSSYAQKVTLLNSWDRFIIPHPFSRAIFKCGKAVYVPPDADEDMIEQKRSEIEDELRRISEFTEKYYSNETSA